MSAETLGSRWGWEEQPSGLDMEIRCRTAGPILSSEGVSAIPSAIVDKVKVRNAGGGHDANRHWCFLLGEKLRVRCEELGALAAELPISY